MHSSESPYLSEEAHVASLQGVAPGPAEGPCKETTEFPGAVANDERGSPGWIKPPSNDRRNGALHSKIAVLAKDFCSAKEELPPSKGTLRRRKKVTQLREAAS